jgi:hypothetical protein
MVTAYSLFRAIGLAALLLACRGGAMAQKTTLTMPQAENPVSADKAIPGSDKDKPHEMGPIEEEMRKRREIKLAEKEYQENVDRAREAAELGAQLRDAFERNNALGRDDNKKLERLEKLTKRIRSEAGGSDEDATLDNPPHELKPALSRLADVAASLRKIVEKTPRQVVSATVIDQANTVLQLLKLTRGLVH